MKKVFFFGTGYCAKLYTNKVEFALEALGDFQIVGFLDNDADKTGILYEGYNVYNPDVLKNNSCDMVLLFLLDDFYYEAVFKQLSGIIPSNLIHRFDFPLKLLLQNRYKNSDDIEIRQTLEYISNNKLDAFNQFIKTEDTYDEVKWDNVANLPYVDFTTVEGKKVPMFYPRNHSFVKKDGRQYVMNLLREQSAGSPHLYVKDAHNVSEGDYIIDAGVCEGNFALRYINVASHIYLFEMDPIWQEPLRHTFKNYESKITIIDKAVADKTSNKTCRIDDIIGSQRIDFIKMDIEGAEISAIEGAKQTFLGNNIKSSICCYHKRNDEKEIRQKLEMYGYRTSVSNGYMVFIDSDDTWKWGDLRRGIVYGDR